jgi:hypothetical protein
MAICLRDAQSGANSGGLLLVAECKLGRSYAVLIAKIEQERGMRAEFVEVEGRRTFDMTYYKDLFFTNRSKVYKVGLFSAADLQDEQIQGWAADRQMSGANIAAFFLHDYLGCQHLEEPAELTKRFYHVSQEWINTKVPEPHAKAQYSVALAAELQSQRPTISATKFARANLEPKHQDGFVKYVAERGVPVGTIDKSTALVANHLDKFRVAFASGITLSAPLHTVDSGIVQFEDLEGSRGRVTIEDEVSEVKGQATPGRRSSTQG